MLESRARAEIVRFSRRMYERGWVANHDGNLSARVGAHRLVCTPTAVTKADVEDSMLVVTDLGGKHISGTRKTPSEFNLHVGIYRARSDVHAVVHAHPPHATALGVSGRELLCFLPESVVSLGERVALVPLAQPGAPALAALEPFVANADAVLVTGNGVVAWGHDVEQAFLRLELVEHLASIAHLASAWGGPQPLPREMVERLLEARKKAFPALRSLK